MADSSISSIKTPIDTTVSPLRTAAAAAALAGAQVGAGVAAGAAAIVAKAADSVQTAKQGRASATASLAAPDSDHGKALQIVVKQLTTARERQTGGVAVAAHAISDAPGPFKKIRAAIAEHADKVHAHAIAKGDTIRAKTDKIAHALPGEPVRIPEEARAIIEKATGDLDTATQAAADSIEQAIRQAAETLKKGPTPPHEVPAKLKEAIEDAIKQIPPPVPLHQQIQKTLDQVINELKHPEPSKLPPNPLGDFPLPDKKFLKI